MMRLQAGIAAVAVFFTSAVVPAACRTSQRAMPPAAVPQPNAGTADFSVAEADPANLKLTPDGDAAVAEWDRLSAKGADAVDSPVASPDASRPVANHLLQRKYPNVLTLHGPTDKRQIALTFDDGPDRRFTPKILDILHRYRVPATFFVLGSRAKALPDAMRRIAAEGHAVGNHSYWHPKLFREPIGRLHWEATQTDEVIRQTVGYRPKMFRAPYGALTEDMVRELARMDYRVVGWSADSQDWRQIPADQVVRNVMRDVRPGAIILFHSGGHWTEDLSGGVQALERLIPTLRSQGYEFVTVPRMLGIPVAR